MPIHGSRQIYLLVDMVIVGGYLHNVRPWGEVPMSNVVTFRRFRVAQITENQFLPQTPKNMDFAQRDLAKSGLTVDDVEAYVHPGLQLLDKASAGYMIPYYDLDGKPVVDPKNYLVMWRMRLDYPEFVKGQRYHSVSKEYLENLNLPSSMPYIPPIIHSMESEELICAEGEKKCAAIIKHLGLPAFGIGGCQTWRDPDGSGRPHQWILELLRRRGVKKLTIVPDGDVLRYDICAAYGTYLRAVEAALPELEVSILHPHDKIDDLLVKWGPEARANWDKIPRLSDDSLVQSPKSLIEPYSLAVKVSSKGVPTVLEHSSNITKLLTSYPAFPKIWLNQDSSKIMLDDEEMEPLRTEMDIANYFQYNLGLSNVKHTDVRVCIQALARANKRSPFFDYIKAQIWDGRPRLDTWLSDYWGLEDTDYHREIASKFLIASCARQDKPGEKLDWIFITIGPQRTGKTTMPFILFPGVTRTIAGESDDKDLLLKMHSSLCVGFDELDALNKKEQSHLKSLITTGIDNFRPPYASASEDHKRRFVLYGSGNKPKFLQKDPTGYRRYAIVTVPRLLDFSGLEAARDQLWAEAFQRYTHGNVDYWEIKGADEAARNYTIDYPLKEQIEVWLSSEVEKKQSTMVKNGMLWFTMNTVLMSLGMGDQVRNTQFTQQISALLVELGCSPPNSKQRGPTGGIPQRYYTIPLDALDL